MTVDIGASGFVGIGIETTPGTYAAPTKFFPIRSESLNWIQNTVQRRVIRGTADVIGAVPGNGNVEGDLDIELLDDVLPYLLLVARGTLVKTGAEAPFIYTFTPDHSAVPSNTASLTVVRNGVGFGYTGVVVASQTFGVDDGMATMGVSLLGREEEEVAVPGAPAYNPDDMPFGAGTWEIEIPTETQVFDSDNFSLEIDDSGEVQTRLIDRRGAAFIKYGERSVSLSVDRDFESRAQYDEFKELTSQGILVRVSQDDGDRQVEFEVPTTFIDSYGVNLNSVGDLIRSSTTYIGTHDTDGAYQIEITSDEDVTIPA